jgi:AAHS family benzoate transporter-like MFS transporter
VGRLGAILGPILGGALMAMELDIQMNFIAVGIPAIVAAIAISLVGRSATHAQDEEEDLAFAAGTLKMEVD